MADMKGIVYLRAARGPYPVIYDADEAFPIGGSKTHHASQNDQVILIGAGVTVHQCPAAADELAKASVRARVIDLYSIKPLDTAALIYACRRTGGRLVVAEDHYPQGGIGGAVMEALADAGVGELRIRLLGVNGLPVSGRRPDELLDAAGISARHIVAAARELIDDL